MSGTPETPIRILLVDDHLVVREGLRMLLENVQGFNVVGQAAEFGQGVGVFRQERQPLPPALGCLRPAAERFQGSEVRGLFG